MIPYGRQEVTAEDIAAVVDVLHSDFLTQGPEVPAFEQAVAERCRATHAVGVNSATSALHIACLALGLRRGHWLWTSPITFVASANCGLYCGARVDFVDIDPETFTIDPFALEEKLKDAAQQGRLPKVLVVVHMSGHSADMKAISGLAREYGIRIIEDAAHAIGAEYEGGPVGGCRYSDITVFSFHPVKIITSAEGGMALTNEVTLATSMEEMRSHGITHDRVRLQHDDAPWYYEQQRLGFNYRLPDVLAALGRSQLGRLNDYIAKRHAIASRYDDLLEDLPLILPNRSPFGRSALHLYIVQVDHEKTDKSRQEVFEAMRAAGIGVQVHYIPVHLQPWYRKMGFAPGMFPAAESYYARALSLPIFPGLSLAEQDRVVRVLREILG